MDNYSLRLIFSKQKNNIIFFLFILALSVCFFSAILLFAPDEKKNMPSNANFVIKKPFVIVNKHINWDGKERCLYKFVDGNQIDYEFVDSNNKYNIGDTIK